MGQSCPYILLYLFSDPLEKTYLGKIGICAIAIHLLTEKSPGKHWSFLSKFLLVSRCCSHLWWPQHVRQTVHFVMRFVVCWVCFLSGLEKMKVCQAQNNNKKYISWYKWYDSWHMLHAACGKEMHNIQYIIHIHIGNKTINVLNRKK